jgi:hypothetical protein
MSLQCRLKLATVLILVCSARAAHGQTAMVRSAPPGSSIELTLNGGAAVTVTADGYGDATLTVPPLGRETDVQIHVDVCATAVKVLINEPGQAAASADVGCTRKDMWGVYVMRSITTFVIEVNGADASVFVAQGPPPRSWLQHGESRADRLWGNAGKGLVLSAGGGLAIFSEGVSNYCGNVSGCTSSSGFGYHLGAEFWITPHFAAQGGYLRPDNISASGGDDTFTFATTRTMRVMTIGGKAGVPVGHGRVYGLGGWNHHEATDTTTQTVNDQTITVDGVSTVIKGGTQGFGQKTRGWGWIVGGGYDLWVRNWLAVYAELTEVILKGSSANAGASTIDERSTFVIAGIRARLWK